MKHACWRAAPCRPTKSFWQGRRDDLAWEAKEEKAGAPTTVMTGNEAILSALPSSQSCRKGAACTMLQALPCPWLTCLITSPSCAVPGPFGLGFKVSPTAHFRYTSRHDKNYWTESQMGVAHQTCMESRQYDAMTVWTFAPCILDAVSRQQVTQRHRGCCQHTS